MTGYRTYARTITGMIVIIPLHVRDNQKMYAQADKSFVVIRAGQKARARLAPEHYGLFTGGTSDIVVRMI